MLDLPSPHRYVFATFDASKFLLLATVSIFFEYSCSTLVIWKFIACDCHVDLFTYTNFL